MSDRFDNKVAIVTGASSGIGEAVARALVAEGASVTATYNSNREGAEALLNSVASLPGKMEIIQADVSKSEGVDGLVSRTVDAFGGGIDILVNNAGDWMDQVFIDECPDETWDRMMDVNLKSVFLCCRAVIPVMKRQGGGSIVNVTSAAGFTGGGGGTVPYGVAKGGANIFTKGLARELAPHNIRVNAVAPGVLDTPMQHRHASAERRQVFAEMVPLKRMGTPEEMVAPVLLLASDDGSYMVGAIVDANGGLLMR